MHVITVVHLSQALVPFPPNDQQCLSRIQITSHAALCGLLGGALLKTYTGIAAFGTLGLQQLESCELQPENFEEGKL